MTDEEKSNAIVGVVENLPDPMTPHDIIVLFLMILEEYAIEADIAAEMLMDTYGIYADHP